MSFGVLIKKPDDTRRTFQMWRKHRTGERKYEKIDDRRLDSINFAYLNKVLTVEDALLQVRAVRDSLRDEHFKVQKIVTNATLNHHNYKLFEDYMSIHYKHKKLLRPQTVRNEFMFALRAIEPLSLLSVTQGELQKRVDGVFDNKQHKRYTQRLNALLEHAKREFTLHSYTTMRESFKFVTFRELQHILSEIQSEELRYLYGFLYATGMRLGEAFMHNPRSIRSNGSIYIDKQLTEKLEVRAVKNKKAHSTVYLKEAESYVIGWLKVKNKETWRKRCQHPLIEAARKVYYDELDKQVSPHSLRHSFAVRWCELGLPLDKVAKLLGDSIKTAEMYYSSFVVTDLEVEVAQRIQLNSK